ncbi:photosystem II stability/assembly factor-like uncharacterized protein [Flavobacteriaceae bacterium MAR_2010_72]|nr:photosystem II stability/assembly factor-like uncharacterized protein [Flavobacteriaceae bacterium MAR_2010_72]
MTINFCKVILFILYVQSSFAQNIDFSSLENLNIRNVGPANMSGRITAIDVVENNPKIIYVGAASGGVWKSENGGSSWNPIFDNQPTQNIGAIAIQQSNPEVVWVGTGEGNPRNSMNLGMGIFKSDDGGKTWLRMGLERTKTVHRISIDPNNPNTVYVGAMGDPFSPNEHRGLYKTTDGGLTWKRILSKNNTTGVADLVRDRQNPNKLFVALYEHKRTPYYFTSGGSGSGLYMTLDDGETWKQIEEADGFPTGELGRIGIAIAPSDSNRIYAKVEAKKNALYRSDDAGVSWYLVNDDPKFTNNRPFYFQDLAVDSKNPDRLYNIYQPLSVSYDGGKTFDPNPMIPADETKGIHADFHAFWVNPNDPEHFIIGGDGGLGITYDQGKSWYFPETIPVAQFYQINVDNDMPYNVYGGMQDNGNWSGPGYTWKRGGIRTLYWQYLVGGDGFYISPDKENSRFGYGTSQNGNIYRYDKLTGYYVNIQPPSPSLTMRLRFNWNAGFAQDPWNSSTAYYGSQFVHVTHDKGQTWDIISPDLTTNNPEHQQADYGGLTLDVSGAEIYNSILSIAPSPVDQNVIWVGTDDGQIQLTKNKGKSWVNLTKNVEGMPKEAWIARLKASNYSAGTVWMVVNNYRKGDYNPYVFKTDNFGQTWTLMADKNKVKGYALAVIQDPKEPNLVFLGTENGLWMSFDKGNSWTQVKNGFPSVSTMDLTIQERESALIIGTFGRAIWILDDLLSLREIAGNRIKNGITALPVIDAVQVKGLFIAPPGNIWTGFHTTFEGENRVFQKTKIPFYINEKPDATSRVKAEIYDKKQRLINTVEVKSLVKGLNYLIWNLDERANSLSKAKLEEGSSGIKVLPGEYTIVLNYKSFKDSTAIKVINDPRFELDEIVDVKLYEYRKLADVQVGKLFSLLNDIDVKTKKVEKIKQSLKENITSFKTVNDAIEHMLLSLDDLRSKGQTPRPKHRQVGAWQSFEVSPYSKLAYVLRIAAARTTLPSSQDLKQLEDATKLIDNFELNVNRFLSNDWNSFVKLLEINNIIDETHQD